VRVLPPQVIRFPSPFSCDPCILRGPPTLVSACDRSKNKSWCEPHFYAGHCTNRSLHVVPGMKCASLAKSPPWTLAAVQNSIIGPSSPVDDGCALHVRRGPATVAAGVFSGGGRSMTLVRFGRRVFPRRLCFALLPSARALQAPPGRRCTAANASPVACRTGGAVLHVRRQCG